MHAQGEPATMQDDPHYDDVVADVLATLEGAAQRARAAGITRLWLDPGIGFGKTVEHNLTLLAHLDDVVALARRYEAAVLVGTSRKRFLARLSGPELGVEDRFEGSLATAAWALANEVAMVRVHDVDEVVRLRDLAARPVEEVVA
jgi:dihydropteroate synthase